ncbi:MAG: trigger factor [Sinobacteraceae bacterium]|nr:trigger factor [Nevskiaceae bacterium]MCP5359133.1 trigger factor [Nevskiaceae bacterium]MCP5466367.1 trigger factor [Nevskiaceae bacterium]
MQVSLTPVGALERRLEVAVPAQRVAGEIDQRLKNIARTARLKGFRPGKAPFVIVKQQFGSQVQSEVVTDLMRESFAAAVDQEKLRPATDPRIESVSAEAGADLRYVAVFEVLPEFKVKPVETMVLEKPDAAVTEADIDAMLETMRKQRPVFTPVEREARDTDQVVVDFEGRIDGELFQGGTGKEIPFVLGAGRMLKEFEAGVRGARPGETRTVKVDFPADYGSAEVAGKSAEFTVTVGKVEEQSLPVIDEEFCQAFGVHEGGVEALRIEIRKSMERELAEAVRNRLRVQVMDALHRDNSIEVPKAMVEQQVQAMQVDMARRMGVKDASQLPSREGFEEPARRRVALGLIVSELIRAEGIKVERERVNTRLAELVAAYPNADEMRRQYLQSPDAMRQIESAALEDQLIDWIVGKATVTPKAASFGELTGFGQNSGQ